MVRMISDAAGVPEALLPSPKHRSSDLWVKGKPHLCDEVSGAARL